MGHRGHSVRGAEEQGGRQSEGQNVDSSTAGERESALCLFTGKKTRRWKNFMFVLDY
jgi:hypothetical protein